MKQRLAFTVMMSFALSSLMSCWVTYINLGYTDLFFHNWLKAFLLAWPAAGIIAFTVGPRIHQWSMRFK